MGFRVAASKVIFIDYLIDSVVVLAEQFAESAAPVPEETFAHLGTADDLAREHRQPRQQIVAPARLELLGELRCPGICPGLVAVNQQISDAFFAEHPVGRILIKIEIGSEISHPGVRIKLVNLQPCRFRRGWGVDLSGDRPSESVDSPASGRQRAFQFSVRGHLPGEVDDVRGPDRVL